MRSIGFLVFATVGTVAWGGVSSGRAMAAGGRDRTAELGAGGRPPHRLHRRRPGGRGAGDVADRQDGADRRRAAGAAPALTAFLRARRVTAIDLVLLTHRHDDHLGGLAAVVRTFGVRMFMDAPFRHAERGVRGAAGGAGRERQSRCAQAERGRTIDLGGGATITLLTPPDPPIARSRSDVNANSVVVAARLPAGWACCSRPTRSRRPSAGCCARRAACRRRC